MTEKELLDLILPTLHTNESVELGAGDDCAVIHIPSNPSDMSLVTKVDTIVEAIHFNESDPAGQVGHKALARPLSDYAAMGTQPMAAMVSISIPEPLDIQWVTGFYQGVNHLARHWNVAIVGGETTRIPSGKVLSVSVFGFTERGRYIRRLASQPGDALFVTGSLGGSIDHHHLHFQPRLREGIWLANHFDIHSMMDLSDGLGSDLRTMLDPLGLGIDLLRSAIPVSRAAIHRFREGRSSKAPLEAALTDGEDYELIFTVSPKIAVPLKDAFKLQFPDVPLTCIGKISTSPGIRLQSEHGFEILRKSGFDHFQSNPPGN